MVEDRFRDTVCAIFFSIDSHRPLCLYRRHHSAFNGDQIRRRDSRRHHVLPHTKRNGLIPMPLKPTDLQLSDAFRPIADAFFGEVICTVVLPSVSP